MKHTRCNSNGRGMPSSPLGSTNGRTTSGVACHHLLWAAHTVERRQAWHAIVAHGRQTLSNDIRRDMPSPPLDSTHDRTTPGVACHHRLWAAETVEQCQAWHAIIALGRQTRSNNVRRDMPSPPLESTHGGTTSGVACHHRIWAAQTVERRMAWLAIIAFGLADTVGRRQAWHAIITLGRKTWSNDVGRGMPSPPLDNTHGRQRRAWHADITALGQHTRSNDIGVA